MPIQLISAWNSPVLRALVVPQTEIQGAIAFPKPLKWVLTPQRTDSSVA